MCEAAWARAAGSSRATRSTRRTRPRRSTALGQLPLPWQLLSVISLLASTRQRGKRSEVRPERPSSFPHPLNLPFHTLPHPILTTYPPFVVRAAESDGAIIGSTPEVPKVRTLARLGPHTVTLQARRPSSSPLGSIDYNTNHILMPSYAACGAGVPRAVAPPRLLTPEQALTAACHRVPHANALFM